MNWIGTWCAERCTLGKDCNECSEICDSRLVIANAVGCSEHLVWMLMFQRGCVTSPHIADAIADYIGATVKQRDSIVHPKHRGTWTPNPELKGMDLQSGRSKHDAKPVVVIDRDGDIVRRFASIQRTAMYYGCSRPTISLRCNGGLDVEDEFILHGISFRFEADWVGMTRAERYKSIQKRRGSDEL